MIFYKGKYLDLLSEDGWEYVRRNNSSGVVVIVAKTREGKAVFVEQFRKPVKAQVIEWPAGLVSDGEGRQGEALEIAARRELLEETGYEAGQMIPLVSGPVASGLSTEVVSFFEARDLVKKGEGGGDHTEDITVHEVPLAEAEKWLKAMERKGFLVDPKVYAGLYFLKGAGSFSAFWKRCLTPFRTAKRD